MNLINWPWLEDLAVRAAETEIREFAAGHGDEAFFAFCLDFDGLTGGLELSYGTREAVESAVEGLREKLGDPIYYREVELRPENWAYRRVSAADPDGVWERLFPILERYRENMGEDQEPAAAEFFWLRFEYLAESVVRRLTDRGACRHLRREPEFLAFSSNQHETFEELEDKIEKLYPRYRRATVELVRRPKVGALPPRRCQGKQCGQRLRASEQYRCTHCGAWFCDSCSGSHTHPELFARVPLFLGREVER